MRGLLRYGSLVVVGIVVGLLWPRPQPPSELSPTAWPPLEPLER